MKLIFILAAALAFVVCADPDPPVWPDAFDEAFDEKFVQGNITY